VLVELSFNIYIAIKYFAISKIKLFIVLLSDFDEKDVDKKNMVSKYMQLVSQEHIASIKTFIVRVFCFVIFVDISQLSFYNSRVYLNLFYLGKLDSRTRMSLLKIKIIYNLLYT
jgi:hypothetical protein